MGNIERLLMLRPQCPFRDCYFSSSFNHVLRPLSNRFFNCLSRRRCYPTPLPLYTLSYLGRSLQVKLFFFFFLLLLEGLGLLVVLFQIVALSASGSPQHTRVRRHITSSSPASSLRPDAHRPRERLRHTLCPETLASGRSCRPTPGQCPP